MNTSEDRLPTVVTFTCFRYSGLANKLWALSQMRRSSKAMQGWAGLQFFKLLGTGQGFHYRPNLSAYGIIAVWESREAAQHFFQQSPVFRRFVNHSREHWTVYLKTYQSHGYWSGQQPFMPSVATPTDNMPVAVLTRATIQLSRVKPFWRQAIRINRQFHHHEGCLLALGVGEWPFFQQATFSIWKDQQSMYRFAYQSKFHQKAIQMARKHRWFKEDLFARFVPVATEGSWYGANPLPLCPDAKAVVNL